MSRKNMRPGTLDWHRRMRRAAKRRVSVPADPYEMRLAVLGRMAATMKGKPYEDLANGMAFRYGDGYGR